MKIKKKLKEKREKKKRNKKGKRKLLNYFYNRVFFIFSMTSRFNSFVSVCVCGNSFDFLRVRIPYFFLPPLNFIRFRSFSMKMWSHMRGSKRGRAVNCYYRVIQLIDLISQSYGQVTHFLPIRQLCSLSFLQDDHM